jgi:tetratricopeptide (TPR) repeat protein
MASAVEEKQVAALEVRAAANPQDDELQLARIKAIIRSGAANEAMSELRSFLKRRPASAEGHLQLAYLQSQGQPRVPRAANQSATRAISLGLSRPTSVAAAHQIMGRHNLDMERPAEALDHFDKALDALAGQEAPAESALLRYFRAMAYRRRGQYPMAHQEIQQAIALARNGLPEELIAAFERERETIELHAGRSLGSSRAGIL